MRGGMGMGGGMGTIAPILQSGPRALHLQRARCAVLFTSAGMRGMQGMQGQQGMQGDARDAADDAA